MANSIYAHFVNRSRNPNIVACFLKWKQKRSIFHKKKTALNVFILKFVKTVIFHIKKADPLNVFMLLKNNRECLIFDKS